MVPLDIKIRDFVGLIFQSRSSCYLVHPADDCHARDKKDS